MKVANGAIGATAQRADSDGWLTLPRFAALFALLVLAAFSRLLFSSETFFHRDFGNFGYPLAFYSREAFWRGEVPLWNPLSNCGLPFLAQWNTQVFYPPSLFYIFLPLSWALGIFCVLHLYWAGLGMYCFAWCRTRSRFAAAMAGVVFGFNGLIWYSTMWPHYVSSLAWMPWVILSVEAALKNGGRHILLAGLVGAMQMLSGTPEIVLFTWFVASVSCLDRLFAASALRIRIISKYVVIILLVTALSAIQLFPFLDLLAHSQRDAAYGAETWSLPVSGWANYLVPLFRDFQWTDGVMRQYGQEYFSSYYLSEIIVLFALFAIWKIRHRQVIILAILTGFCVVLSMGPHGLIYTWIRQLIPQLGFMRYPVKFIIIPTFTIPLIAAYAASELRNGGISGSPSIQIKQLGRIVIAMVIVILAIVMWECNYPVRFSVIPRTITNGLSRIAFLLAGFGCFFLMQTLTKKQDKICLTISLLTLIWLDVFTHVPTSLAPTVSLDVYRPDIFKSRFKADGGVWPHPFRVMTSTAGHARLNVRVSSLPRESVSVRRLALFDNLNLLDHIAKVDGFFALYTPEEPAIGQCLNQVTNGPSPLLDFLSAVYVSNAQGPTNWDLRLSDSGTAADSCMPIVTIGQQPVFKDDPTTLREIADLSFKPRSVVYLPVNAASAVHASYCPAAELLSSSFSAQSVTADVISPNPAIVVIAQTFFHSWQAYVDNKPTPLWRANYGFQSLEVPAGTHHIEIVYEDRAFHLGRIVSCSALACCAMILTFVLFSSRRNQRGLLLS